MRSYALNPKPASGVVVYRAVGCYGGECMLGFYLGLRVYL